MEGAHWEAAAPSAAHERLLSPCCSVRFIVIGRFSISCQRKLYLDRIAPCTNWYTIDGGWITLSKLLLVNQLDDTRHTGANVQFDSGNLIA